MLGIKRTDKMSRKPKLKAEDNKTSSLLEALQFVSLAQTAQGMLYETHVILHNGWLTAFNGTIAAGVPIQEHMTACPHSASFAKALDRSGDSYTLTQLEGSLCIQGAKFKAFVPCAAFDQLQRAYPDQNIAPLGDEFRKASKQVLLDPFADDNRIISKAILARRGSCVGTNGVILIEAWHGFDLPNMSLPKAFVEALAKTRKHIVGFGCSNVSATLYFDDGSWLRTQLYIDEFPSAIDAILNERSNPWPVPKDFFEAVRAMLPFLDDSSSVTFDKGTLRTHASDFVGAQYRVEGLPDGPCFNAHYLLEAETLATTIDFVNDSRAFFFGDNVRGIIMGMAKK